MEEIVYSEGHYAYKDCVRCSDNPYVGVSEKLARIWEDAWWDTFYEDQFVYALRKRRYELKLGARAVADRIGYEVDTLQGWEMGRTTPNIFAVEAWAQGLGLKLTFAEQK